MASSPYFNSSLNVRDVGFESPSPPYVFHLWDFRINIGENPEGHSFERFWMVYREGC